MDMFLEATNPKYVDRIYDGHFVPSKIVPETPEVLELYIPQEKMEWTARNKTFMMKDAKVRNLLHNSLDNMMSNRVIGCNTAKEIQDTLEVRLQDTKAIKKNRSTVHIQEYEHFDSKDDESINETYDRFVTLLNDVTSGKGV